MFTITFSKFAQGAHTRHKEMVRQLLNLGWEVYWIGLSEQDLLVSVDGSQVDKLHFIKGKFEVLCKIPFLGKLIYAFLNKCIFNITHKKTITHHLYLNNYLALGGFLATYKKIFFFCRMDIYTQYKNRMLQKNTKTNRFVLVFLKTVQYLTLCISEKYIVQTEPLKTEIVSRFNKKFRVEVLPNNAFIRKSKNERKMNETIKIGFMANMHWEMKGLDILSEYFQQFSSFDEQIVIAGDGPDLDKLKTNLNIPNVNYLGRVDGEKFLLDIDVLLVTTRFDYCPNILLEAMSFGVPIIASNIPVHRYLLGDEHPGLFDIGNVDNIRQKINQFKLNKDNFIRCQNEQVKSFYFNWGDKVEMLLLNEVRDES